jgi:hypothetical protein
MCSAHAPSSRKYSVGNVEERSLYLILVERNMYLVRVDRSAIGVLLLRMLVRLVLNGVPMGSRHRPA